MPTSWRIGTKRWGEGEPSFFCSPSHNHRIQAEEGKIGYSLIDCEDSSNREHQLVVKPRTKQCQFHNSGVGHRQKGRIEDWYRHFYADTLSRFCSASFTNRPRAAFGSVWAGFFTKIKFHRRWYAVTASAEVLNVSSWLEKQAPHPAENSHVTCACSLIVSYYVSCGISIAKSNHSIIIFRVLPLQTIFFISDIFIWVSRTI
jgi:hypothetical protein